MLQAQPFNGGRLGVVDRVQWHGLKGYRYIRKPQHSTRLFKHVARSADGDASSNSVSLFTLESIRFLSCCVTSDLVCRSDVPFFFWLRVERVGVQAMHPSVDADRCASSKL